MSEPTPLNAEELAWLSNSETFRDPDARWDTAWLRSALATIDAQATEIAALKGALEKAAKVLASSDGCGNGPYGPICFRLTGDLCTSCAVLVAAGVKVIDVAPPREYNMGENPAAMLPSFLEARNEQ